MNKRDVLLMALICLIGLVVSIRACIGPFHLFLVVDSPVNSQCLFGVLLTTLAVSGDRHGIVPIR